MMMMINCYRIKTPPYKPGEPCSACHEQTFGSGGYQCVDQLCGKYLCIIMNTCYNCCCDGLFNSCRYNSIVWSLSTQTAFVHPYMHNTSGNTPYQSTIDVLFIYSYLLSKTRVECI